MPTYSPRRFSQPAFLKTIHPSHLVELLERYRHFLSGHGVTLPARSADSAAGEIDYEGLVRVFMTPDMETPHELRDALYLINEMSSTEAMDILLPELRRRGIQLDNKIERTPGDIAIQTWLRDPNLLQRKHAEKYLLVRPRSYTSYRSREPSESDFRTPGKSTIMVLEAELGQAFDQMGRSPACRILVFPQGDEVWFLVGHGDPYRREGSLTSGKSTQVFFRPERSDVVVYCTAVGELRANARSPKELELYRTQFGRHLFGDPEWFQKGEFYTLEPLCGLPDHELVCSDISGMEWVRLIEIRFWSPASPGVTVTWRSEQLSQALATRRWRIPGKNQLKSATFQILFSDSSRPRSVTIRPPDKTSYTRDEDSECVEEWLRERGFIMKTT